MPTDDVTRPATGGAPAPDGPLRRIAAMSGDRRVLRLAAAGAGEPARVLGEIARVARDCRVRAVAVEALDEIGGR
jgi:hypothetical protein